MVLTVFCSNLLYGFFFSLDGNFKLVLRAARATDKPDRSVLGSGGFYVDEDEAREYLGQKEASDPVPAVVSYVPLRTHALLRIGDHR